MEQSDHATTFRLGTPTLGPPLLALDYRQINDLPPPLPDLQDAHDQAAFAAAAADAWAALVAQEAADAAVLEAIQIAEIRSLLLTWQGRQAAAARADLDAHQQHARQTLQRLRTLRGQVTQCETKIVALQHRVARLERSRWDRLRAWLRTWRAWWAR